jgi:hypothetical protein
MDEEYDNLNILMIQNKEVSKRNQQGSESKTVKKDGSPEHLTVNKSVYNIEILSAASEPKKKEISIAKKEAPIINEEFKMSTTFLIRKQLVFGHRTKTYLKDKNMAQYLYLNQFHSFVFMHFPKVHRKISSRM